MQLAPGAVIGELYEIVAPIGKGGMATVYAARQLDRPGQVAVKVLSPATEDKTALKRRFFRELLFATRVQHPNIVPVHDFGVMHGTGAPYIVMELLHGQTLHRAIRQRGALAEDRVIRLFLGVLSALAKAHSLGVVHRDLKPSNLFLCANDDGSEDLVVLDFGIAHRVQGLERAVEWTAATPRYAPPEFILRYEVRPCLDVYQVGLVMAEALAGAPVVPSADPEQCFRTHLRGPLELPPQVAGTALHDTIQRAIHPDPDYRFADAGELLRAVEAIALGEPPALRRAPPQPPRAGRGVWTRFALDADDQSTQPSVSSRTPATRTLADAPPAIIAPLGPPRRRASRMASFALAAALLGLAIAVALAGLLGGP